MTHLLVWKRLLDVAVEEAHHGVAVGVNFLLSSIGKRHQPCAVGVYLLHLAIGISRHLWMGNQKTQAP